MTHFNQNTSIENLGKGLRKRLNHAQKHLKSLLSGWRADWNAPLKPGRLRSPRKLRAGFTLTETLLVIIVVISVLAGLLALYNGVKNHLRNAALQSQMIRAVGIIERAHSYSGTYGDGSLVGFLNGEGFSANQVYKNTAGAFVFKSPYETAITITGGGTTAPTNRHFTMVVADLPPAACKLAALVFRDSGSGLDELKINGGTAITPRSLEESAVDTACNTGANDKNSVSLKF